MCGRFTLTADPAAVAGRFELPLAEADIRITRALRESAKVLDIPLLDHVIVGSPSTAYPEGWFSFKAAGYL